MIAQTLAGSTDIARSKNDFYATPQWATNALLDKYDGLQGMSIWEPACGDGAISEVLKRRHYGGAVYSSDIEDHGYGDTMDFLTNNNCVTGAIVTNPPYSLAQPFVTHALKHATVVAMLLKLNFLEGQRRKPWLETTPLEWVYVFSRRVSFNRRNEQNKDAGLLAYAWYVWDNRYIGDPKIGWL